jgi:predicted RNA-binding Zn-ribbon protein involved in translation (DUF1610 family)
MGLVDDETPCPVCGSEERHPRTGLLTCKRPAPRVKTVSERRTAYTANGSWPERRVVRTGVSPMNPKVKWAELNCGHTVWRQRKPRIDATIVCEECGRRR